MIQMNTFRPMFSLQWRVAKWPTLALLPLCFGLPILVVRFAEQVTRGTFADPAIDMLRVLHGASIFFALLSAIAGFTIALSAWVWDHNTRHVYPLSLPIERWRYALHKMLAGATMLAGLVAAVFVASLVVATTTNLPSGLHAYPVSFTIRFLLGALISYAVMFAFAAGTVRTTIRIIVIFMLVMVVYGLVAERLAQATGAYLPGPFELVANAVTSLPGPFNVFGTRWMLIDV